MLYRLGYFLVLTKPEVLRIVVRSQTLMLPVLNPTISFGSDFATDMSDLDLSSESTGQILHPLTLSQFRLNLLE